MKTLKKIIVKVPVELQEKAQKGDRRRNYGNGTRWFNATRAVASLC
jgi:hypothetical protein